MNILTYIFEKTRPYHLFISTMILALLFGMLGYFAYTKYFKAKQSEFSDVANANNQTRSVQVMIFHVDWCPHCKQALPEFEKFSRQVNGQVINGYTIECSELNCTDDNGDRPDDVLTTPETTKTLIRKYGIDSYPTIKMIKDGDVIDYNAKVTAASLQKFVETMTK